MKTTHIKNYNDFFLNENDINDDKIIINKDLNDIKRSFLSEHLNDKQVNNIMNWFETKTFEFINNKLKLYGVPNDYVDSYSDIIFENKKIELYNKINIYNSNVNVN